MIATSHYAGTSHHTSDPACASVIVMYGMALNVLRKAGHRLLLAGGA